MDGGFLGISLQKEFGVIRASGQSAGLVDWRYEFESSWSEKRPEKANLFKKSDVKCTIRIFASAVMSQRCKFILPFENLLNLSLEY